MSKIRARRPKHLSFHTGPELIQKIDSERDNIRGEIGVRITRQDAVCVLLLEALGARGARRASDRQKRRAS